MISFFFFQAEDGIRDIGVTGVQTCALPISGAARLAEAEASAMRTGLGETVDRSRSGSEAVTARAYAEVTRLVPKIGVVLRSEERRVGKECRSRWSPYH